MEQSGSEKNLEIDSKGQHIKETNQYKQLKKMLGCIENRNGKARFLLLNPYCDTFNNYQKHNGKQNFDPELYLYWRELEEEYTCLEIHVYSCNPLIRMQFINKTNLLVSGYNIGNMNNLKFMKIITDLDTKEETSLYQSFSRLYEYVWEKTEALNKVIEKHNFEKGIDANEG